MPAQIAVGEAAAVTVGLGFTVKIKVAVLEQAPLAPVTVYIVLEPGETVCVEPINAPGFHV
jgi:hypothetical protein